MVVTAKGMRVTPKSGNRLGGFTAYKIYNVIAGYGDANVSPTVSVLKGMEVHSKTSCNVVDDNGKVRFVTLDFFREFKLESGVLFK